mmetsp:Transcript_13343/g.20125  ORF Transcript_13343/g.20125 Transcript_13343/m.20125 type:complete len:475 (-) Transcript_13343:48-1472(-)
MVVIRLRGKDGMFRYNVEEEDAILVIKQKLAEQLKKNVEDLIIGIDPAQNEKLEDDTQTIKERNLKNGQMIYYALKEKEVIKKVEVEKTINKEEKKENKKETKEDEAEEEEEENNEEENKIKRKKRTLPSLKIKKKRREIIQERTTPLNDATKEYHNQRKQKTIKKKKKRRTPTTPTRNNKKEKKKQEITPYIWIEILTFINRYELFEQQLYLVNKQFNDMIKHPYLYKNIKLNYEEEKIPQTRVPRKWLKWTLKTYGKHIQQLHIENVKLKKQLKLKIESLPNIKTLRLNNVDPVILLCYEQETPILGIPFQLVADNQQLFSWKELQKQKNTKQNKQTIEKEYTSLIQKQKLTWTKQFRIHLRYRKHTCSICIHPSLPLGQSLYEPLLASGWFDKVLHQLNIRWSYPLKLTPVESLHRLVMCLLIGVLPKPIALNPKWSGRRLFPPTFQPLHETTLIIRNRRLSDYANLLPPM